MFNFHLRIIISG